MPYRLRPVLDHLASSELIDRTLLDHDGLEIIRNSLPAGRHWLTGTLAYRVWLRKVSIVGDNLCCPDPP